MILLRKPNKLTRTPKDLRPITLLPVLGKLLEKLVVGRSEWIITETRGWSGLQYGFTTGRSTTTAIHDMHKLVQLCKTEGKHVVMTAFDIS